MEWRDEFAFPDDTDGLDDGHGTDEAMEDLSMSWFLFGDDLEAEMTEFAKVNDSRRCLEQTVFRRLSIEPAKDLGGGREYLAGARYEMPKYNREMTRPEALLTKIENPVAWMDFMCGMPFGSCEMLVLCGEVTTKRDKWPFYQNVPGLPVPMVPSNMFEEERYGEDRTPFNLVWLESDRVEVLAQGLAGEPEPSSPNWWLRVNFVEEDRYPYPGEFVGLAVRIFPGLLSGAQPYNPFLYSGHWFDTAYVTSAEAVVVEAHPDGYCICTVNWRVEKEVRVYPTDFARYKVGDRVVILKDVGSTKPSQTWKDEDCFEFDRETWRVVPLTYYGKGFEE